MAKFSVEPIDIWVVDEKEPTARQIREREVYEAKKAAEAEKAKPRQTAADRRNFYRKQAGWPLLKVK